MRYIVFILAVTGLLALSLGCGSAEPVEPQFDTKTGIGSVNVTIDDSKFTPEIIEVKSGQRVRLLVTNKSATKDRSVSIGDTAVKENGSPSGVKTDFLEYTEIIITGPVKMIRPGTANVNNNGETIEPESSGTFMVVIAPSQEQTVIEFTVPDMWGEFELASFANSGKDYDDISKGIIKGFPKDPYNKGWAGDWKATPTPKPNQK